MRTSREALAAAMAEHGIELPLDRIALLDRYCATLWEWNARLNLTRHTDYQKFVTRDLVDSLAFSRFLAPGERVLDVGTGGGVPGVVLAILRPDLPIALCESVGKRAGGKRHRRPAGALHADPREPGGRPVGADPLPDPGDPRGGPAASLAGVVSPPLGPF